MDNTLVFYQFSRGKVERGDFQHFLRLYAFDQLPEGRPLRAMANSMSFAVHGYDNDPRELHSIPEVRAFYASFLQAWPYWLYFCNLETEGLQMMALRCLPSLTAMAKSGVPRVTIELNPDELIAFVRAGLLSMNEICDRAEIFESGIYERTKAVFGYYGLPFDAAPPAEA